MPVIFESGFEDGLVSLNGASPVVSGRSYAEVVDVIQFPDDVYSGDRVGHLRTPAFPDASYSSDSAKFRLTLPTALPDIWFGAWMKLDRLPLAPDYPLDTDHLSTELDAEGRARNLNRVSILGSQYATVALRLYQQAGVDPPNLRWELVNVLKDPVDGIDKYYSSTWNFDGWSGWMHFMIHWWNDPVVGGADVFMDNLLVQSRRGNTAVGGNAGKPALRTLDFGGNRAINFIDYGLFVDDIAVSTDPLVPSSPLPNSVKLVDYLSIPADVEAIIDGPRVPNQPLASGSIVKFLEGEIISITVPSNIER